MSIETGVYFIQNAGTGTVIDLNNGLSADGTQVHGYQKRELSDGLVPAQLWIVSLVGNDVYTIENTNSRTYLDLSNAANGTHIIGYQGTGEPNQRWSILRNSADTAYVIQNLATDTFVDLSNGDPANLTPVNGWAGQGVTTPNNNQLWKFIRV
ncbi:hypothetical protein FOMPIDRAFT_82284 [Fomitopsis schrenkii]|uniref:Ricin B lectin domain-containing protein n=1 Tax=Fomitopsis schrenkii TaxID=2126942 RepID=S8DSS2_FOMSC|nr:hypothetical protein FOMPIDRAFT_82284 [Fomitopsis schrenkii]